MDAPDRIPLDLVRDRLHERGQRWTPQRRVLLEVLAEADGHVTGAELVERCRALDPATIPSTVYRTLDVLEELGLVGRGHGPAGREEYHVLPDRAHGHLHCVACGDTWDIPAAEASGLIGGLERDRRFRVDITHLSIAGWCEACRDAGRTGSRAAAATRPAERAQGDAPMTDRRTIADDEDPVCGMTVDLDEADARGLKVTLDGREYVFCGKGCLLEFRDDPERYLAADHQPAM